MLLNSSGSLAGDPPNFAKLNLKSCGSAVCKHWIPGSALPRYSLKEPMRRTLAIKGITRKPKAVTSSWAIKTAFGISTFCFFFKWLKVSS